MLIFVKTSIFLTLSCQNASALIYYDMDQVVAYGLLEGQRGFSKQWLHRGCVIRNDLGSDLGTTLKYSFERLIFYKKEQVKKITFPQ